MTSKWMKTSATACTMAFALVGCKGAHEDPGSSANEALSPQPLALYQASVSTQHNNSQRTGANLGETTLTPAALARSGLNKAFGVQVDGGIVVQPLYSGGSSPIVYTATLNNSVYAINASTGAILWKTPLPDPIYDTQCKAAYGAKYYLPNAFGGTANNIPLDPAAPALRCRPRGIQGTPVYDSTTGTLYVVFGTTNTVRLQGPLAWHPPACPRVNPPPAEADYCVREYGFWNEADNSGANVDFSCLPIAGQGLAEGCTGPNSTMRQNWTAALNWLNGTTTAAPFNAAYWIAAIQMSTGAILKQTQITGTSQGVSFDPRAQMNRPGLLLSNGHIYAGFGASSEYLLPYHGWIFSYAESTLAQSAVYDTTPKVTTLSEGGGVWQAGGGLTADSAGNVYFASGNGITNDNQGDWSNAIFKLDQNLNPLATPYAPTCPPEAPTATSCDIAAYQGQYLDWTDLDLGAGGTMLIQDGTSTPTLLAGGKTGVFYLMDTSNWTNITQFRAFQNQWYPYLGAPSHLPSAGPLTFPGTAPFPEYPAVGLGPHLHGSPVYWHAPDGTGRVYAWSEKDVLKAFQYEPAAMVLQPGPVAKGMQLAHQSIMPGGMLSLSANGSASGSGVVWATLPYNCGAGTVQSVCGMLLAYNAETLVQLFAMNLTSSAGIPLNSAKWAPPTVADGWVFLGTQARGGTGAVPELQIFKLGT